MSAFFDIESSTGAYRVEIDAHNLRHFIQQNKQAVAICDERFAAELRESGIKAIPVTADENVKNLDAISGVITALRQANTTRDTLLLAVGGGIVQDVAAFCAAIYMRGLAWVYAPTTLLGMVDSCIGGKSSINVGPYKNLVGTFNPPQRVLIDVDFVTTLSVDQRVAGLVEAAKICFCRGQEAWSEYWLGNPSLSLDPQGFSKIISTSLAAKKWFIEIDEFDRKERLLLNFGHTFGHALEGASRYRVSHGIAVGIGMLCALSLGQRLGCDYSAAPQVAVLRRHLSELLAAVKDLPLILKDITSADLFDRFTADKKHKADVYRVVTVAAQGHAELISLPKNGVTEAHIKDSMTEVLTGLCKN